MDEGIRCPGCRAVALVEGEVPFTVCWEGPFDGAYIATAYPVPEEIPPNVSILVDGELAWHSDEDLGAFGAACVVHDCYRRPHIVNA